MMPYCVGLTGSIGVGKSVAMDYFKALGAAVFSADEIARELTTNDAPFLMRIREHVGHHVFTDNHMLDRRALRNWMLASLDNKNWLEAHLHPLIRQRIEQQLHAVEAPYAVVEIPLLIAREGYPYLQRVLLIKASEPLQIERIMARDNVSAYEAQQMLAIQPDEQLREAIADDRIVNDGDLDHFKADILTLHRFYLNEVSRDM